MITSETGISFEILVSLAAGIVAWVGSYMTTKTKVDNLQSAVNTLTNEVSDLYAKLQEETKTVKNDISTSIDKLERETKNKCTHLETALNNIKNEIFNVKIDLQNHQEDRSKSIYGKLDILRDHINSLDIVVKELEIKINGLYKELDKYLEVNNKSNVDSLKETIELLITILDYKDKR